MAEPWKRTYPYDFWFDESHSKKLTLRKVIKIIFQMNMNHKTWGIACIIMGCKPHLQFRKQ